MKPFDLGADLVYHSATKFLSGHGTVIGGVLVDGGSFDWERSGRFPELTAPYEGFHDMVFSEESTVGAFLLRARREGLRDFGACMSPHTAWLILQGIETLPLRMERHMSNTRKVVEFLAAHPFVERVGHPMLESHPSHALAQKLLPKRRRLGVQLRPEGQPRAGQEVHRGAEAVQPPGQRRRLPLAGDPSGQHHALPHERRGAGRGRHRPRARSGCRSAWKIRTT